MAEQKKTPPAPQRTKPVFQDDHVISRGEGGKINKTEKRNSGK